MQSVGNKIGWCKLVCEQWNAWMNEWMRGANPRCCVQPIEDQRSGKKRGGRRKRRRRRKRWWWCEDHPENNLAKFGYILDMELFLKNPSIFVGYLTGTYYKNMAIWKKIPFKIWRIWAEILAKNSGSCVCVCVSGTRARAILEAAIESHMWAKWGMGLLFFIFISFCDPRFFFCRRLSCPPYPKRASGRGAWRT